jgi:BirA family biotin operon repressor/biotin-[acetyl-CoA-carboxylase] ligase
MEFPIQIFESLSSTNDSILAAGEAGAPEGTTHIALEQRQGRGRGSHTWWSPRGAGLWMSTLLRPRGRRSSWGGLSLIAGAAVQKALSRLGVRGVGLYWPNDLYAVGRKLGGILGEVRSRGDDSWIALGIGLNIDLTAPRLRGSIPRGLAGRIVSLVEVGFPGATEPAAIARAILRELWPLYLRFLEGESVACLAGEELAHAGRRVEIRAPGGHLRRATVLGLSAEGELLVEEADGKVSSLVAAEVNYDPANDAPPAGGEEKP